MEERSDVALVLHVVPLRRRESCLFRTSHWGSGAIIPSFGSEIGCTWACSSTLTTGNLVLMGGNLAEKGNQASQLKGSTSLGTHELIVCQNLLSHI